MGIFALVATASLLAGISQVTPATPPPEDDIVVEGRRREVVQAYVRRVTRPETRRQLARWNDPLCVRYKGMDERFADFIHTQVSALAARIGLKVNRTACAANVLVELTDRADTIAHALVHYSPPLTGSLSNQGLPSDREIKAIEAPHVVRWLTTSETLNADGMPIGRASPIDPLGPITNRLYSSSLIRSSTTERIRGKIVLIDTKRLRDVTLRQLAEYVAFVTFASPDIAADFSGLDSIMALFASDPYSNARLSEQDFLFIDALYELPQDRAVAEQRRFLLTRMMQPTLKKEVGTRD